MALHNRFFIAGIVFVIIGMCLGIWMGMKESFTYAPVHAHLNLVGWATHFLYGLYYRGEPQLEDRLLPRIQFWCAVLGLVIMAPGIAGAQTGAAIGVLAIPGSLLTLAAMVIFLIVVAGNSGKARMARAG
jgi:hypothetical protein